jgi:hypothetical protein
VIKCLYPGCTTQSKNFEGAKISAQLFADKHLRRFPHHVLVRYEQRVGEIFQNEEAELPEAPPGEWPF